MPLLIFTVFARWCWEWNFYFRNHVFPSVHSSLMSSDTFANMHPTHCSGQCAVRSDCFPSVLLWCPHRTVYNHLLFFRDRLVLCISFRISQGKEVIAMVLILTIGSLNECFYCMFLGPNSCEIPQSTWNKSQYVIVFIYLGSLKHLLCR